MKDGPAFTLDGMIVTENKTGTKAAIQVKDEKVTLSFISYQGKPGKEQVTERRIINWYRYKK